jgi:SAM-dependent methyltransferase
LKIETAAGQDVTDELRVVLRMLPLQDATILELGCGAADKTRQIASRTAVKSIVAAEVDMRQHGKNLQLTDLPKVVFKAFGAEAIAADDDTFDAVLMFKSLHHVPAAAMATAFAEIHRVLKPGGLAYLSEPVFAGAFNDIMRLFHDEQRVRQLAFDAIVAAVTSGLFSLREEYFFRNVIRMTSWDQYEAGVLGVSHTNHTLTPTVYAEVKRRFLSAGSAAGYVFEIPNRVDLLQKKA